MTSPAPASPQLPAIPETREQILARERLRVPPHRALLRNRFPEALGKHLTPPEEIFPVLNGDGSIREYSDDEIKSRLDRADACLARLRSLLEERRVIKRDELMQATGWEGHPDALIAGLIWSRYFVPVEGGFRVNPEPMERGPAMEAPGERLSEAELLAAADQPFPWIVDKLIPRGGIVGLVGNQGAGKTPFLLQLLLSVESGKSFLGRRVMDPVGGLFWSAEDASNVLAPRYKAVGTALGLRIDPAGRPRRIQFKFAPPRLNPQNPNALYHALAPHLVETRARLVAFDTMAYVGLTDENSASEFHARITLPLRELVRATDATIIVTHHTGKKSFGTKTREDAGRGTSAMKGDFDALLNLEKQNDGLRILTPSKVKGATDADKASMSLDFNEKTFLFSLSANQSVASLRDRILSAVRSQAGLSSEQIVNTVKAKRKSVLDMLASLEAEGVVQAEKGGSGKATLWSPV